MIEVLIPEKFTWAKEYCIDYIFKKRYGFDVTIKKHDKKYYLINISIINKSIKLPDIFFKNESKQWLKKRNKFNIDIKEFDLDDDIQIKGFGNKIYSIFHNIEKNIIKFDKEKKTNFLPVDIFGSLFFMFSSYEEYCTDLRDSHLRFSEKHSCLSNAIYSLPIIDIQIELLWIFCKKSFPNLERKVSNGVIRVTCDIDHPYSQRSLFIKSKNIVKFLFNKREYQKKTSILKKIIIKENLNNFDTDYAGLKYILNKNQEIGNKVIFYSIPQQTYWRYDTNLSWKDKKTRIILNEISKNGNTIGIHPGYNTYDNLNNFKKTLKFAKKYWPNKKNPPTYIISRQHYLRWDAQITPEILNTLNIDEDSSLGFANFPGFRNGTCFPYFLIDLKNEKITDVTEIPLILMESSVFSKNGMNINDPAEAYKFMNELKMKCFNLGGVFTLLWHNSNFTEDFHHEIYENIIK